MRIRLGEDEEPEIGLIALIDCIFFLLMFFMVATSFKQQTEAEKRKELPVVLPSSSASLTAAGAAAEPLVIGVDKAGRFFVDGAPVGTQALHDRLRAEARADPHRRVRIDGDRASAYQHIVHVLDLCQLAGLTHIAMHTRR
ncbi:MAG: biopolymer transporter ExbD [Rubrivivax sp.]|nr:biopolymer transporter ExbD [Rubrivivax sp.]